jgi:hypothetical protein
MIAKALDPLETTLHMSCHDVFSILSSATSIYAREGCTLNFKGVTFMRIAGFSALLCAFAIVLSTGAFAKVKNQGSFDLAQPAIVGTTQLQPGHYKAEWTGTSGTVNVDIMQNGKTVATATGTLKELSSPSPYSAVTLRVSANHQNRIEEIDFNHYKDALVLSGMRAS